MNKPAPKEKKLLHPKVKEFLQWALLVFVLGLFAFMVIHETSIRWNAPSQEERLEMAIKNEKEMRDRHAARLLQHKPELVHDQLLLVKEKENGTFWFPKNYFPEVSKKFLEEKAKGKKITSVSWAPAASGQEEYTDPRPDGYWVVIE